MLDHVFTDAIDALRQSLEKALLERLAVEEHLTTDLLSGDMAFDTSYGLLGEEEPPRVRADLNMSWSARSQAAFRDWYVDDVFEDAPRIELEVTLAVQRLAATPDPLRLLAATPALGPTIGGEPLHRGGPTVEQSFAVAAGRGLGSPTSSFEVAYGASYELDEPTLQDSARIDVEFSPLGGWIASALVRLNDLGLEHMPPHTDI